MAKQSRLAKIGQWFRDALAELRRVVWPTPQETRNLTLVVIGLSVSVGLFLGFFDWLFSILFQALVAIAH